MAPLGGGLTFHEQAAFPAVLGQCHPPLLAKAEPQGLYAELTRGNVPAYLEPVPATGTTPLRLFRVKP